MINTCVTTCVEPWGKTGACLRMLHLIAGTVLSIHFLDGDANLMVPGQHKEPDPGKLAENFAEVLSDGVGLLDVHSGVYPLYILKKHELD